MGAAAFIEKSKAIFEGDDWTALARLTADDGTVLIQSDFTDGDLFLYDKRDPATQLYTVALTISAVVFNSLQQDGRWDKDRLGYNFRHKLTAAALVSSSVFWEGGHEYRAEYILNSATHGEVKACYDIPVIETYTNAAA